MTNIVRYLGDIHGNMKMYSHGLENADRSVQVGDYGIGFHPNIITAKDATRHRFIRGNHDDPAKCKTEPNYIPDGYVETIGDTVIMYIGGAMSIDRDSRIEGVSWWRDEELEYSEFLKLYDKYMVVKPNVMVTHECPDIIANMVAHAGNKTKLEIPSITRNAFENMWTGHAPDLWVFGHWHIRFEKYIMGTRFLCLNEFDYIDIDMDDLFSGNIERIT